MGTRRKGGPDDDILATSLLRLAAIPASLLERAFDRKRKAKVQGKTILLTEALGEIDDPMATQALQAIVAGLEEQPSRGLGSPFGRYRPIQELGRGGMGTVWSAWDSDLKRVVALKRILPVAQRDPRTVARFVRESQSAARLRHPHIVTVFEAGVIENCHYFTSELIEGQTLLDAIEEEPDETCRWIEIVRTGSGEAPISRAAPPRWRWRTSIERSRSIPGIRWPTCFVARPGRPWGTPAARSRTSIARSRYVPEGIETYHRLGETLRLGLLFSTEPSGPAPSTNLDLLLVALLPHATPDPAGFTARLGEALDPEIRYLALDSPPERWTYPETLEPSILAPPGDPGPPVLSPIDGPVEETVLRSGDLLLRLGRTVEK